MRSPPHGGADRNDIGTSDGATLIQGRPLTGARIETTAFCRMVGSGEVAPSRRRGSRARRRRRRPCRRSVGSWPGRWPATPARRRCRAPGRPSAGGRRGGRRRRRARGSWSCGLRGSARSPGSAPPFCAGRRAVGADRGAVHHDDVRRLGTGRQRRQQFLPEPALASPIEPVEQRRARAVLGRDRAPAQPLAEPLQDAADHPTIVHSRLAAPMRQQRLDRRPLCIAQPQPPRHRPCPERA